MTKLAPHPDLERYYDSSTQRQSEVDIMFDESARYYDRVTQIMSFGSGSWYRKDALKRAGLTAGCSVLDTGAGTGALTLPAQALVGETGVVVALDPSANMLAEGVSRGINNAVRGLGEHLPMNDATFDFVTMGYALRHVSDLTAAFDEYRRVLKPGGKVVLLEITSPENRFGLMLLKGYMRYLVPVLAGLVSGGLPVRKLMEYYWDTIEACVRPESVIAALTEAEFADPKRTAVMGIFSEYTATKC
jgi:demethylmenaquinone methyltransferase/2-methoxy-6-polyprenyl-1,4-benzoquinol methylase